MKKLLNLLLTLAVVSSAVAATVNRQQAREAAAKFMQQKGIRLDEASQQGKKALAAEQPVYVFNASEGQGFVIVSGDDRTDAILGYTTEGTYDEDNLPENFREWLNQMTAEIEALQQLPETEAQQPAEARAEVNGPKAEPRQVGIHAPIAPLILTTWNQGNTYNKENYNTDGIYNFKLPKEGSYYPCTGCVATAGAQIMYYFKCPQGPTTVVPGYKNENSRVNTTTDLPSTEFQWDKMKTSYSNSDAYSEAAEAVAELMLYAGYAAHMRYSADGSSANQMTLARGMAEYFGYDPNTLKYIKRSDYSVAEWDELMYNELANGRPIIYDGAKGADGSNGHAFLCDGYDGAGLYHFNWGWGGSSNGYFKLQATNPDGPNGYPGYIFNNSAVIGIQPNTGIVPEDPNADDEWETPVIEGLVASVDFNGIDGTNVSLAMWNKNEETCGFGFGIGELLDNGTINVVDNKYESYINSQLQKNYGWGNLPFDFSTYAEKLTNGTHKLIPISRLNGETEWKRCRPADLWFEVNVEDRNVTTIIKHPFFDVQINKFEMVSPGIPGNWQKMLVNITNNGDNIEKNYYIYVNGKWPAWTSSVKELKIASGNTKEFFLETGELAKGHYTLTLRDGYNGPIVATQEVDIKQELVATAFNVGGELKFVGTTLPVDVTVENHAGDNTMPLYLFASKTSSIGSRVYAAGTGIPAGGSEDVRFYFTPNSSGTWYLRVGTDANGNNIIGEGSVVIESAPSGTVTLELTGKEIICKPGGKVDFKMSIKNTGNVTNYRGIRGWLYTPNNDGTGYWSGIQLQSEPDIIIEPGKEVNVTLTYDGLTEKNEYGVKPLYATTYSASQWTELSSLWDNTFTYNAPAVVVEPGDTSGDGELNVEDVNILVNYLTGNLSELPANADANGDEKVDISDIVFLISKIIPARTRVCRHEDLSQIGH